MRSSGNVAIGLALTSLCVLSDHVTATAATDEQPSEDLSEIIVSAQKRDEPLQEVPASISVLNGLDLERLGSTTLADFGTLVPGLSVISGGTPGQEVVILRGISDGTTESALVGTYVDDTPVGSSSRNANGGTLAIDLLPYDLERLEVLRGPQGTLYGAGAMGGLLKYVLRPADLENFESRVGGSLESTDGTFNPSWTARAALNAPLINDVLAVRVSAYNQHSAGYIDNVGLAKRGANSSVEEGGRVALQWKPSDNFRVKASTVLQDIYSNGNTVVALNPSTLIPEFGRYAESTALPESFYQLMRYFSLTADGNLGFATVTSAASYSHSRNTTVADLTPQFEPFFGLLTGGAITTGTSPAPSTVALRKFTEELRLTSPVEQKAQWMLGFFYTDEHALNLQYAGADYENGTPIPLLNPLAVVYWPSDYRESAVFGNVTYPLNSRLDMAAGARWSTISQDFFQSLTGTLFGPSGQSMAGQDTANVETWMVGPRWHASDRTMAYLRASSGYEPGGPNAALPGVPRSFKASSLISYELGAKTTQFNGQISLDVAAFYIDWSQIQVTEFTPEGLSYPGNGGKASSRGVELTSLYKPIARLKLGVNVAHTLAKLDEDVPSIGGRSGDELPLSPRWNGSVTTDYSVPLSNALFLIAGGNYRYRGPIWSALPGTTGASEVPRLSLADLYIGTDLESAHAQSTLRLYARNVFNSRQYNSLWLGNESTKFPEYVPVEPRTVGVSAETRF